MKNENPFLVSGYIDPTYFCDRVAETAQIISALQNGRNLTLASIRRMGKTGLIKNVFYHLKYSKYRMLYLDILPTTSMQEFARVFSNAIIEDEKKYSKDYLKKISRLISGLKAQLSFDSFTGNPVVGLGYVTPQEAETGIGKIFDYLSEQEARYIVAMDEFQQITTYREKNVEAILRSYMQQLTGVVFVFSGSQKHLLSSMFSEYGRPFYQSTDFLNLERIPEETYADFILEKFSAHNRQIERTDITDILHFYDCYTFYIQSYFNRLFSTGDRKITKTLIEETKAIILDEREYIYYSYQNLLTSSQFEVLKAIAKEGAVGQPNSKQFMERNRLVQPSSINTAIKSLLNKELIYKEGDSLKVYDVFFSKWLQSR